MAEVILNNLVKEYRDTKRSSFRAVNGIDLEIRDREFMVLVGPSGCGKSTSLRMIAGLEDITGGTISIDGQVVNDIQPKDRNIAMVFQNYALYPHMSVFDNMAFGLKLLKYSRDEIKRRVDEAADILGLETMLDRKPKQLSGGQRQRVAVGRAIVRKPKVFLFDEPLSNLDAKMRVQMRTEIAKLHAKLDATMIYVTHDQVEAMTMGDRICVMKDGDIMQVDEPLRLYNQPKDIFTAGFIGSPPMNFFTGQLIVEGDRTYFLENNDSGCQAKIVLSKRLAERVKAYGVRSIVLGVRPEDVTEFCDTESQESCPCIRGTVEVSEPMGAETYLYIDTGAHRFIARVHAERSFSYGEKVTVSLDLDKVHFFDPDSGKVFK